MTTDLESVLVSADTTIGQTITQIDRNRRGIVLVVDVERRLQGTITDGDVRRAILTGVGLDTSVSVVLALKAVAHQPPVTALMGTPGDALLSLMRQHSVRHVPLMDGDGRVEDLATLDDLVPEPSLPLRAVIMAGGRGTRLRPFTDETPKPMLMVGDRPLMEHIVERLRDAGIRRMSVATRHLAEKITEHFKDGREFGVELNYVEEDEPLGTAGALSMMENVNEPLLVVNGDVLTQVNFRALLAFHREHQADMTVAVSKYDLGVPYGVVECDEASVRRLVEKPVYTFLVNAGIYLLEPSVRRFIPRGERFDMTDLIGVLLAAGRSVVSFPILEYWLDVGKPLDYEKAKHDIRRMKSP